MLIGIFDDRCVAGAAPAGRTCLQVFDCPDGVYFADVIITLDNRDFCLIFPYNLEDFFHGLFKFVVTDAAANIEGNIDFGLVIAQLPPQIQPFGLAAVAAGRRFLIAASYGTGQFLQIEMPGKGMVAVLDLGDGIGDMI